MPLLNICSVTRNKKTIQAALCFLSGEKKESYKWAMKSFKKLRQEHRIPLPSIVVLNKELALLNTFDTWFLTLAHLLCIQYVNINILANCCKHFLKDMPKPGNKTSKGTNRSDFITDPKQEAFLKDQASLLASNTEAEYKSCLIQFYKYLKVAVQYIKDTQLKQKEKLV